MPTISRQAGLRYEETGTYAPMMESLETRMYLSGVDFVEGKLVYQDSVGSTVTVTLKGGGSGVANFPGEAINNANPSLVIVPASDKCTLTITVKGTDRKAKNVTTIITGLTVTDEAKLDDAALKSIKAAAVTLSGNLTMNAVGATITLGNLTNGADVLLSGASEKAVTTLTLGQVGANSDILAAGLPLALSAKRIGTSFTIHRNNHLSALYLTKITVAGLLNVNTLVAAGTDAKGVSIGSLTVGSRLFADVTVPGRVNSVIVGDAYTGTFRAESVGTITTKGFTDPIADQTYDGDWYPDLVLSGTGAKGVSIGTIKAAGNFHGHIDVPGRINRIAVADGMFRYMQGATLTIKAESIGSITARHLGTKLEAGDGDITDGYIALQIGSDAKGVSIGSIKLYSLFRGNLGATGRVNRLTFGGAHSGSFEAASIGTLTITGYTAYTGKKYDGYLESSITLSGVGVKQGKNTLGSAKIFGKMTSPITITGNVGTITVNRVGAFLFISGKAKSIKTLDKLELAVAGGAGHIQVQGGGKVIANNGKFTISGTERLYVI